MPTPQAKTFLVCHGAWGAGYGWRKMHPLMAAAGHRLITPSYTGLGERSHLAHRDIDLESHITDILQVIKYEDLSDIVLIGHSYGGMVATGVADRARDRIKLLVYLDAFVPKDGQALADLVPPEMRQRMKDSVKAGDGWRVAPNPPSGDTAPEDLEWIMKHRLPQSLKCFEQPVGLQGELTVPRSYIQCMRFADHGPFSQFAKRAKSEAGWRTYEMDASHSPNVTNPELLMKTLAQVIAAVK